MAQILVRGIDDDLMTLFKARAKAQGKSTEQAVRELIESSARAGERQGSILERITALREDQVRKYGTFEDSAVDMIREDRDSR